MKKIILLAIATVLAFTAVVYAQQNMPPADKMQINLKEAWNIKATQKGVLFNHEVHLAKLDYKCESCHSSPQGATKIVFDGDIKGANANNPAHKFCWTCHDKTPKPNKTPGKTCTKCHTLPK